MLFAPSGKGQKRQKKGEKSRFRPISRKGGQTPLKRPFVTPPFAAAQDSRESPRFALRIAGPSKLHGVPLRGWHVFRNGENQGPLNGGVSNGGVSRSGLVLPFVSFFGPFPIFLGFSRFARGWSGDFPDLSFSSFSAY